MDEKTVVRGLCNMLKIPESPGSSDLIDIPQKIVGLVNKLPTLFSTQQYISVPIRERIIAFNEYEGYPQNYLVVLGQLTKYIGTQLYMKETLLGEDIITQKRIIIIGHQTETTLMYHVAEWLWKMHNLIYERIKGSREFGVHPAAFSAEYTHRFYYLITIAIGLIAIKPLRTKNAYLIKRDKKVYDYMINNYIFEKNNKRIDPIMNEAFDITKFQIKDGKFTKYHLLWA